MWHGYIVIERGTVGAGNWSSLQTLFEDMGTHQCPYPCWNTHWRARLDGDAVIYESKFDPDEVSVDSFKELLADEFGVDAGDIEHTTAKADYAGHGTTVWEFLYGGVVRFVARRFGQGGDWTASGDECRAYLIENMEEWETGGS